MSEIWKLIIVPARGSRTVDGAAIADDRGADLPPDGGGHVVIVVTDRSVQKWRRRSGQSELNWLRGQIQSQLLKSTTMIANARADVK